MSNNPEIGLNTNRGRFDFFVSVLKRYKRLTILYLLVIFCSSLISAFLPYFAKLQIDLLEQKLPPAPFESFNPLVILIILLLIPAVVELIRSTVISLLELRISSLLYLKMNKSTEALLWNKMKQLDAGFFQSQRNKKLLNDVVSSSHVIKDTFKFLTTRAADIITFIAIIPLLGSVSVHLLIIIVITSFFQYLINTKLSLFREGYTFIERRVSERTWQLRNVLENDFFELKSLGSVDTFIEEFYLFLLKHEDISHRRERTNAFFYGFTWFLENFLLIFANVFVGFQVIYGEMSLGTFTLVVSYTSQISGFFHNMISSTDEWKSISISMSKLDFFLQLKSRLKKIEPELDIPGNIDQISLSNVSFKYPDHYEEEKTYIKYMIEEKKLNFKKYKDDFDREQLEELEKILESTQDSKEVLSNVSFALKKGMIVALVGRNGSGKTTLTHVLQHHYEPTAGKVELNGRTIYEYNQEQLIQTFSWLQQDPFVLDRYSIRDNLILGARGSKDEVTKRMQEVIKAVSFSEFVKTLPKGLDTVIGEDTSLSGGQRQLIAVARALIQDRAFIIFDEGSSQLDIEKEYKLLKELSKRKKTKGILFITHRMSVASKADHIYVIDQGQIIESGSHKELIAKKGLYATFWQMQTEFELTEV